MLDKEKGLTSRKVDNAVGKIYKTHKVGHLGTLDPFATGLLVIGVEKGNKALSFICDETKEYVATLKLGEQTSTGDIEGETILQKEVGEHDKNEIEKAVSDLLNIKEQLPPMTSAIKIGGKALYKYAHKGEEIERKSRPIEVYEAELLNFEANLITFRAKVSKGTYLRVLGESLAESLGEVGHLISLRRTKVGEINVEDSIKLAEVGETSLLDPTPFISLRKIELAKSDYQKALNGVKLDLGPSYPNEVLLTYQGKGVAVYERSENGLYASKRGLF